MNKMNSILEWAKEPGSIKFLVTIAGLAGYVVDPSRLTEILAGVYALNSVVNGFYDRNKRRTDPPPTTP